MAIVNNYSLQQLIEDFNVTIEDIRGSHYISKSGRHRIRLTNNHPDLSLVKALLPYIKEVNSYIKDFTNVSTHTTVEMTSTNSDPENRPTGNHYRDLTLTEEDINGLH